MDLNSFDFYNLMCVYWVFYWFICLYFINFIISLYGVISLNYCIEKRNIFKYMWF